MRRIFSLSRAKVLGRQRIPILYGGRMTENAFEAIVVRSAGGSRSDQR